MEINLSLMIMSPEYGQIRLLLGHLEIQVEDQEVLGIQDEVKVDHLQAQAECQT